MGSQSSTDAGSTRTSGRDATGEYQPAATSSWQLSDVFMELFFPVMPLGSGGYRATPTNHELR